MGLFLSHLKLSFEIALRVILFAISEAECLLYLLGYIFMGYKTHIGVIHSYYYLYIPSYPDHVRTIHYFMHSLPLILVSNEANSLHCTG